MKKYIVTAVFIFTILMFFNMSSPMVSKADWWLRPTAMPTQPSFDRDLLPTSAVQPTAAPTSAPTNAPTTAPTNPPGVPTATPRVGGPTSPAPTPGGEGSSNGSGSGSEDPCASGKSYEGPYCGWSPSVGNSGGGGGGGNPVQSRLGGPQVLGLSDTSSGDLALSDIMILAGVLCLLVYARSKLAVDKSH